MALRSICVTKPQREALNFVVNYQRMNGQSPRVEDVARALGIGHWAAYTRLTRLAEHGVIRLNGGWRNIEVIDPNPMSQEEMTWCLRNTALIRGLRARLDTRQDNQRKVAMRAA